MARLTLDLAMDIIMDGISSERQDLLRHMLGLAESSDLIPDVSIDGSLVKYSGLDSTSELENSITEMLKDAHSLLKENRDFVLSALSALSNVPSPVGLCAMVLSIAVELIISTEVEKKENKDSTSDMMRRVFSEEKASGVRDTMEEYMKRLRMYLHEPTLVLEETQRLEKQLSEQLTRLKNSMLHDNQMSSRSLKHWTNGAAFHLQMLIHKARLKMQSTTEQEAQLQGHQDHIITALECYQRELEELLKKYKTYKKSNISVTNLHSRFITLGDPTLLHFFVVKDEEFDRRSPALFFPNVSRTGLSDDYVNYMFDNGAQLKELKQYFSDLKGKIKDLILQNDEFEIQKLLPV
ncbi:hypothetical protein Q7C36_001485 [Tachysurus vachellii]|uniref:Uncharacterized protein n=1 Tax=Tachysurus vachellii TaxID=175792 RepID=A0AA88TBE0_TACVA|nr:hypothetical protein Q7C36_001485 [Tachysurus vachellii]